MVTVAAAEMGDGIDVTDSATILAALLGRPDWHARAACRGHDPAAFFPPRGGNRPDDSIYESAARLCRDCPVKLDCLTFALDHPTPGTWGGTTERARRRARARGLDAHALLAEQSASI
jgi:WhiB family transcriptional regulator, redox-sensing transcriptional regulator